MPDIATLVDGADAAITALEAGAAGAPKLEKVVVDGNPASAAAKRALKEALSREWSV